MFNLKYIYPIAIDIGDENIYAAQLKETRQGFVVKGLMHRELDGEAKETPDENNGLISLLKEISKSKRFFAKRAVVHLPSQNIFSFPVRFQVGKAETLEEAILRESKEYIPFPIEEAILDYPSIISQSYRDTDLTKVTVIAVRMDHLKHYLLMMKQAGLTLEAVDFSLSSLIRLHDYLYGVPLNPIILCHVGHTQSLLLVVTKEGILGERNVPWGMENLLGKIQANFELKEDNQKARMLLTKYGLIYENRESDTDGTYPNEESMQDSMPRAVFQIISPYIEELMEEFHKMIGYLRSEEQNADIEGIYIYGQGAVVHDMDGYIARRLNIPTRLVDPMTKIGLSEDGILADKSEGFPFALALGLAMRKVPWL